MTDTQKYQVARSEDFSDQELRYLELLSRSFGTIAAAATEIINLEAILNLPKGTEHFLTDIHGEYEAFRHVLKNASGSIRRKVDELFGNSLLSSEKRDLCTLIYYPEEKLREVRKSGTDMDEWFVVTLNRLVRVCRTVSSKYTRSKVRKALPKDFSYIIQELLHEQDNDPNKTGYVNQIIHTIISTRRAEAFIIAMCNLIQRLTIDRLHIVGDIYDRGPGAHIIMDTLGEFHHVDIQWGNHDLLWMGAFAGNVSCIANAVRMSLRYANLETLEDGYGINLLPLATFAMETYPEAETQCFAPKVKFSRKMYNDKERRIIAQMHKAISIIQWKLEGEIIDRNPDYNMADRKLLNNINYEQGIITIDGKEYPLKDTHFPTIDPKDPYRLTEEEQLIINSLYNNFTASEKAAKHMKCLLSRGSFYTVTNGNLLYHASIPLTEKGEFKEVRVLDQTYTGKALLDRLNELVQTACRTSRDIDPELKRRSVDYMWYLWCGPDSPSFDKSKMATLERYLIEDKTPHHEEKGWYYSLSREEKVCDMILTDFGIDPAAHAHIINGHVPVKTIKGEQPVKANGKLLVIDGGFSRAYQPETGIAGYTLVFHSRGFQLVQHEPFESTKKAIEEGSDIISNTVLQEYNTRRLTVRDTDKGQLLQQQINDLRRLLLAFRLGLIHEHA